MALRLTISLYGSSTMAPDIDERHVWANVSLHSIHASAPRPNTRADTLNRRAEPMIMERTVVTFPNTVALIRLRSRWHVSCAGAHADTGWGRSHLEEATRTREQRTRKQRCRQHCAQERPTAEASVAAGRTAAPAFAGKNRVSDSPVTCTDSPFCESVSLTENTRPCGPCHHSATYQHRFVGFRCARDASGVCDCACGARSVARRASASRSERQRGPAPVRGCAVALPRVKQPDPRWRVQHRSHS